MTEAKTIEVAIIVVVFFSVVAVVTIMSTQPAIVMNRSTVLPVIVYPPTDSHNEYTIFFSASAITSPRTRHLFNDHTVALEGGRTSGFTVSKIVAFDSTYSVFTTDWNEYPYYAHITIPQNSELRNIMVNGVPGTILMTYSRSVNMLLVLIVSLIVFLTGLMIYFYREYKKVKKVSQR